MEFFKLNRYGESYSHGERKELKEQDLIKSLEENSFNGDSSVDCSLSLGLPTFSQSQMNHTNNLWSNVNVSNIRVNNNIGQYQNNNTVGDGRTTERLGGNYSWLVGSQSIMRTIPETGNGYDVYGKSLMASNPGNYNRFPTFDSGKLMQGSKLFGMKEKGESESPTTRRCFACKTTSTPLWRNGPNGSKSLCNACGIRFKKEERRALNLSVSGSKQDVFSVGGMNNNYSETKQKF